MKQKIKLVFLPFIIIAISFIGLYTFLQWFLFIKLEAFSIKEDVLHFWLPFALPWIPVLIWLRPRIKLLNLKRKKGDLPFFYMFIAAVIITIPTIVAQEYVATATGRLTTLVSINQVNKQEKAKYYILKRHFIDKQHVGVYNTAEISGKNNEHFNMHIFIVLPVLENISDTINSTCLNWIGYEYHKQISNRLSSDDKDARFSDFATESQADFEKRNFEQFEYLARLGNTDEHDGYNKAVRKSAKFSNENNLILSAINEPFAARNGNKLPWIFGALGIGAIIWLVMVVIPKFDESTLNRFMTGKLKGEGSARDFFYFFIPREGFYITPIIMNINIVLFVLMVFAGSGFLSFKTQELLAWGANYKPYTTDGQWWRLLTSTFLHGGIMHLLANMYGLLFVGIFLEPVLGKVKYALFYLTTGVIASLASLWWYKATVSVGASGAIFGLYGIFLALLLVKVFPKDFSKAFLASTFIFIGFNLLMGLSGSIDNAAHIGGLVSGFVIGLFSAPLLKRQLNYEAAKNNSYE